jgi:acetyltransferase-like isoleucine patch superfamily enzyme
MQAAGVPIVGRLATRLAGLGTPRYFGRHRLARYSRRGYRAPTAVVSHRDLAIGDNVFIGERVVIYEDDRGGSVVLGDRVHLNEDVHLQTGDGGAIRIGHDTHIQLRCQLSAYLGSIHIGNYVQIAPHCAFYPYDHALDAGRLMMEQPVTSRGDIVLEDDVWLGYGVVVLAGVTIGAGAVVGAASVVVEDVSPETIVVGNPARVVGARRRDVTGPSDTAP